MDWFQIFLIDKSKLQQKQSPIYSSAVQ